MSEKSDVLEAQITDFAQELMDQLAAGKTERLEAFLAFSSRFHSYSWGNWMLIFLQNPDATLVAGFNAWLKKHKNPVRKGERGIRILVPYRGVKTVTNRRTGQEEEKPYLVFGQGSVFDVSQTMNPDFQGPAFFDKLGNDHAAMVPNIIAAMQADGITVELGNTGRAEAYSAGGYVRYSDNDADNQLHDLIHEWGHEINHWGTDRWQWTKGQRECHAEGIAFIVCRALGLQVPFSADYLINHGNDVERFKAELRVIQEGAKHILQKLQPSKETELDNVA